MRELFRRRSREPGWLALSLQPDRISFAHAVPRPNAKPLIQRCGISAIHDWPHDVERFARQQAFARYHCTTLLPPGEYQMLLVDAPSVPPEELKSAVRWQVKDLLDYHLDDATLDVLDVPPGRAHAMYAVAARNEAVQSCIARFDAARIPLSVIDIAETAQRNIAALFEPPERGIALLFVERSSALLTISFRGELYLARRVDTGIEQLSGGARDAALGRIALELQRTFDHFERQYPSVALARLLLGPEPAESGLQAHLAAHLELPVESARLEDRLEFSQDARLDREAQWARFHLLGAALRNETKAL